MKTPTFKVKPFKNSSFVVQVFIHASRAEMRRMNPRTNRKFVAFTETPEAHPTRRRTWKNIACAVHLCVGYLDTNTVSHEATHAAISFVQRKCEKRPGLFEEMNDDVQEAIASTQGTLLEMIVRGLENLGFIEKAAA